MTHNLAELPTEQRKAIERDRIAALWAWRAKRGPKGMVEARKALNRIQSADKRQDMEQRFNRFMAMTSNTMSTNTKPRRRANRR